MTNAEKFEEIFGDKIEAIWDNCGNIVTDEKCKKCDDRFNCRRWLELPWEAPRKE